MPDNLIAIGQRISAEYAAGRPVDQPSGEAARLTAVHWYLSPVCDVEIDNLRSLFLGGVGPGCLIGLGQRSRRRVRIRYGDPLSRRCDSVRANPNDRDGRGPVLTLFSERFLSFLPPSQ